MDAFLVPLPATTSGSAPENKQFYFLYFYTLCWHAIRHNIRKSVTPPISGSSQVKLRLYTLSKSFIKYPQITYTFYFINAILNPSQMYCSHSMTASFILSVFIHSKKSGISPHFSTITTTYLQRRTHDLTHKFIF